MVVCLFCLFVLLCCDFLGCCILVCCLVAGLGLDCLVICGFKFSFVVTMIVLLFEGVIN